MIIVWCFVVVVIHAFVFRALLQGSGVVHLQRCASRLRAFVKNL